MHNLSEEKQGVQKKSEKIIVYKFLLFIPFSHTTRSLTAEQPSQFPCDGYHGSTSGQHVLGHQWGSFQPGCHHRSGCRREGEGGQMFALCGSTVRRKWVDTIDRKKCLIIVWAPFFRSSCLEIKNKKSGFCFLVSDKILI